MPSKQATADGGWGTFQRVLPFVVRGAEEERQAARARSPLALCAVAVAVLAVLALATHSTGRANDDHRNTISLAAKKAALRSTRTPAAGKTAQSMLSQGAMLHSHSGLAHRVAEFDAAVGQSAAVNAEVKNAAAKGLVQEISAGSKAALMHNVRTKLATSVLKSATAGTPTSATSENAAGKALASDKIQLRMFMESRCPGCRETATTWLKEVLDAPGMSDIVDFKAVSWGWAFVEEAPTQEMAAHNITHGSRINTTSALLSLLQKLGASYAGSAGGNPQPFTFSCQHGWGECMGNALEACIQDVQPDYTKFLPVFDCIESRSCAEGMRPPACVGPPTSQEVGGACLEEHGAQLGVPTASVNACFNGNRASELLVINDMETLSAQPQWVPWFTVDGNPLVSSDQIAANDTTAFDSQMLLGSKLCDLYAAKTARQLPAACASFPRTVDALPTPAELQARYPAKNFTALIAKLHEQKLRAAQQQQTRLAWEIADARQAAERREEYADMQQEQRVEEEQKARELQEEAGGSTYSKRASPAAESSWTSGLSLWFQSVLNKV